MVGARSFVWRLVIKTWSMLGFLTVRLLTLYKFETIIPEDARSNVKEEASEATDHY